MRSTASPDRDDCSSKRSRVAGKQSKYGCFTCKARKIKCDESKPYCSRCERSNLRCEGYPLRAYPDSENAPNPDQSQPEVPKPHSEGILIKQTRPAYALLDGFRGSPIQDRLARIGCSVLRDGPHHQFEVSRAVFECLLPQLSHALPSVNAAAAALGAVYEMQTAPLTSFDGKAWLVRGQYTTAIREVQHELSNRPYGEVPIIVACVLLACADVLLHRPRLALMHLLGGIRLLEERNAMSTLASGSDPLSLGGVSYGLTPTADAMPLEERDDEITALFRTLDVQTVLYADGSPPGMQIATVRPSQATFSSPFDVQRISRELIAIMQACYCFTSQASYCKYLPRTLVPANLSIEQGQHIGALRLWLRRLTHDILPTLKPSTDYSSTETANYTHCLMLRNLCISTIIYTSTILDPYETDWDIHARSFQDIVTGAELILDCRRRQQGGALPSSPLTFTFTFTPSPGIIQPLYLTVLKYRHPVWRRRALAVLRKSGKEGPWDGKLMAAAAQCTIDAEESGLARDVNSGVMVGQVDAGLNYLEDIVPECVRISGCGPVESTDVEGNFVWAWANDGRNMSQVSSNSGLNLRRVRLSRCKDVDRMLAAGLEEQEPGEKVAFEQERHWEIWTETVQLW